MDKNLLLNSNSNNNINNNKIKLISANGLKNACNNNLNDDETGKCNNNDHVLCEMETEVIENSEDSSSNEMHFLCKHIQTQTEYEDTNKTNQMNDLHKHEVNSVSAEAKESCRGDCALAEVVNGTVVVMEGLQPKSDLNETTVNVFENLEKLNINPNKSTPSLTISAEISPTSSSPSASSSSSSIVYKAYESESQLASIMELIEAELSEPYSIYTYRYFIYNWPNLCFIASFDGKNIGTIVCKLSVHSNVTRGYIAMLAVKKEFRKMKIGTTLVQKAIEAMIEESGEIVLETEITNLAAIRLYENLGFVKDKRLFRYYMNGVDAFRLKLWLQ